ncbi:hypothetical protein DFH06DRAFT_1140710 [Mycena polygramma]|nr:hypothetical protein DFH06DRAFT_1140710 [Mycena polygramma]
MSLDFELLTRRIIDSLGDVDAILLWFGRSSVSGPCGRCVTYRGPYTCEKLTHLVRCVPCKRRKVFCPLRDDYLVHSLLSSFPVDEETFRRALVVLRRRIAKSLQCTHSEVFLSSVLDSYGQQQSSQSSEVQEGVVVAPNFGLDGITSTATGFGSSVRAANFGWPSFLHLVPVLPTPNTQSFVSSLDSFVSSNTERRAEERLRQTLLEVKAVVIEAQKAERCDEELSQQILSVVDREGLMF